MRTLYACALLYPEIILICTEDNTTAGFGIATTKLSKLPVDASPESIGQFMKMHLSLSESDVAVPKDFKSLYQEFLNVAGLKNAKGHYKNARLLEVSQKDNEIHITPTNNGGTTGSERGFQASRDVQTIQIAASSSDKQLGELIIRGWSNCNLLSG